VSDKTPLEIDWQKVSEKDASDYAISAMKVSELAGQWALRIILSKTMFRYTIAATVFILIAHAADVQPLLVAFVNVVFAALIAAFFQFRAVGFQARMEHATQEHIRFVAQLTKKMENKDD
jgi:hypothetical protein